MKIICQNVLPSLQIGVEQKLNPKLWAKTKIDLDTGNTGHNFHAESRRNIFFLYIYQQKKGKAKVKAKEYSYCFLPESCSRYLLHPKFQFQFWLNPLVQIRMKVCEKRCLWQQIIFLGSSILKRTLKHILTLIVDLVPVCA